MKHPVYPHIFTPLRIKHVVFKNRIWTAPAGVHLLYGREEYPSEAAIAYYANKAKGGSACVTYSAQNMDVLRDPDPLHANENIFKPETHRFFRRLTDAIHYYGAKASLECLAFGYHAPDEHGVRTNWSVNGGVDEESGAVSRPFTPAVLERFAQQYADAAEAAVRCGFDVLLLHGGHGVILSQFLSPVFNQRTDAFGGSFENRIRFPLMVLKAIRDRVGDRILIEYRISGSELGELAPTPMKAGTMDDTIAFLKIAQSYIDIAHISAGSFFTETEHIMHPTYFLEPGCNTYLAAAVKACPDIRIPVLTLGGYQEPDRIEQVLAEGKADIVAMARGTICDPELVNKAREGRADDILPCIKCFHCLDYARNTAFACSGNPEIGRETLLPHLIPPVGPPKQVVVIGGGPSGMEAAIVAARRGHAVTLLERSDRLGGKLIFSEQVSFKKDLYRYLNYQIGQLNKLGVDVRLNTEASPESVEAMGADVVIAALGAEAVIPSIPGADSPNVITAEACYARLKAGEDLGQKFVFLGGGEVGCETALHLAMDLGKKVALVEMTDTLAREEFWLPQFALTQKMDRHVDYRLNARCTSITAGGLTYTDETGTEHALDADTVVLSAGMRPRFDQAEAFRSSASVFWATGDCVTPKNLRTAIRSAYDAASQI